MSDFRQGAGGNDRPPLSTILFDLRTVIGSLFVVYGIVCTIWGLTSYTAADKRRTGDINLNLWTGIGMLLLAAFFLIWSFARPIAPPASTDPDEDRLDGGPEDGAPHIDGDDDPRTGGVRPGAHRDS